MINISAYHTHIVNHKTYSLIDVGMIYRCRYDLYV